ncbi:MAG: hypothetical protein Q8R55_04810 [Candidatus Taylorbacteria bacterium]|nr:hypothetical protein [Candidatus Taylorbacteria bacterium]
MTTISQAKLNVFIYKFLFGILGKKKQKEMLIKLEKKKVAGNLEPIERRVWTAFKLYPDNKEMRKTYIRKELDYMERKAQP